MAWWHKIFKKRTTEKSPDQADRLNHLVAQALHHHRFLGEVLLQIPRKLTSTEEGTAGLAWDGDQLILRLNPARLAEMRDDDAELLLEHEALHVVWQHPARYANYPYPDLAKVATDVAVNQYLPATPQNTATLAQLERVLRRRLPPKQDSHDYLVILQKLTPPEQERLQAAGIKLTGDQTGKQSAPGKKQPGTDTHAGWGRTANVAGSRQSVRLTKLRQLVKQAWAQTPQRDRGLLPGSVRQAVEAAPVKAATPLWQTILRQQLGNIAAGKRASSARFNRRQPLRMDLPGQVSRLVPDIYIFIDNSGSVPTKELASALDAVDQMARHYQLQATVYTFDAKVHPAGQHLRAGTHLKRERNGGGGTSFQSIFDFLRAQHVSKRAVVVVITDGWGEQTLRDHHYRNVDWLLTTKRDQLSVAAPVNRVFELRTGGR